MTVFLRSSFSSPRDVQRLHEKQQENIEFLEGANPIQTKKNYKSVAATIKQARMFTKQFWKENFLKMSFFIIDVLKEHDNDGQIHPVETDELT